MIKLVDERKDEILKLSKEINYDYLVFNYKYKNNKSVEAFTSGNNVRKLKDDYSSLISKAKYTVKHGKGLKILPTDIVQIKALNTSEKVGMKSEK